MNRLQPRSGVVVKVILVPRVCFALQPESQVFAVVNLPLQVGVIPCIPTIICSHVARRALCEFIHTSCFLPVSSS